MTSGKFNQPPVVRMDWAAKLMSRSVNRYISCTATNESIRDSCDLLYSKALTESNHFIVTDQKLALGNKGTLISTTLMMREQSKLGLRSQAIPDVSLLTIRKEHIYWGEEV